MLLHATHMLMPNSPIICAPSQPIGHSTLRSVMCAAARPKQGVSRTGTDTDIHSALSSRALQAACTSQQHL